MHRLTENIKNIETVLLPGNEFGLVTLEKPNMKKKNQMFICPNCFSYHFINLNDRSVFTCTCGKNYDFTMPKKVRENLYVLPKHLRSHNPQYPYAVQSFFYLGDIQNTPFALYRTLYIYEFEYLDNNKFAMETSISTIKINKFTNEFTLEVTYKSPLRHKMICKNFEDVLTLKPYSMYNNRTQLKLNAEEPENKRILREYIYATEFKHLSYHDGFENVFFDDDADFDYRLDHNLAIDAFEEFIAAANEEFGFNVTSINQLIEEMSKRRVNTYAIRKSLDLSNSVPNFNLIEILNSVPSYVTDRLGKHDSLKSFIRKNFTTIDEPQTEKIYNALKVYFNENSTMVDVKTGFMMLILFENMNDYSVYTFDNVIDNLNFDKFNQLNNELTYEYSRGYSPTSNNLKSFATQIDKLVHNTKDFDINPIIIATAFNNKLYGNLINDVQEYGTWVNKDYYKMRNCFENIYNTISTDLEYIFRKYSNRQNFVKTFMIEHPIEPNASFDDIVAHLDLLKTSLDAEYKK